MKKRGLRKVLVMLVLVLAFLAASDRKAAKEAGAGRLPAEEKMPGIIKTEGMPPVVALTFDDGPSAKYTPLLLDGLEERGVKASFFLLGRNIEGNENLVERMQKEGHLIGNHTYNHVQLTALSETRAREEILKTNNLIYEITGKYPQYMRPPFGAWRKDLELCVEMLPVFWTIDTKDWKMQNASAAFEIAVKEAEDGSIILMHDGYAASVEAALSIVDHLKDEGYGFVTADKLVTP